MQCEQNVEFVDVKAGGGTCRNHETIKGSFPRGFGFADCTVDKCSVFEGLGDSGG
jgi:hypothetical protein